MRGEVGERLGRNRCRAEVSVFARVMWERCEGKKKSSEGEVTSTGRGEKRNHDHVFCASLITSTNYDNSQHSAHSRVFNLIRVQENFN